MNDAVTQQIYDLKSRLYGNGQPGDIQKIDERIDGVDGRVRTLEEFRWKALFVAVVLCFLSGGGTFSLEHVWKLLSSE